MINDIIDRYPEAVKFALDHNELDAEDLLDLLLEYFELSPPHAAQVIAMYAKEHHVLR